VARVMVAVSGGVDSAVAALLLTQQGHEVCGVTIQTVASAALEPLWQDALDSAKQICDALDIPHQAVDLSAEFSAHVIGHFVSEYAVGRTPNPCVVCNPAIKWGHLLDHVIAGGYEHLATGHYARIRQSTGRCQLLRGKDPDKDQSYMLYRLSQQQLARTLLPLGEHTKDEVRKLAAANDLPVADKPESQDLCFIASENHTDFLRERIDFSPGPILDVAGNNLGEHQGLPAYTVGQRKGLGTAAPQPLYVIRKDVENNALIVGPREAVFVKTCRLSQLNWVSVPPPDYGSEVAGQLEVRYRTSPVNAVLKVVGKNAAAKLESPQVCAPGQSGVLYDDEVLLGGGVIEPD